MDMAREKFSGIKALSKIGRENDKTMIGLIGLRQSQPTQYYANIKKLETTVLNPPAGEIENFTDDFEDQRNTVKSNLDLID